MRYLSVITAIVMLALSGCAKSSVPEEPSADIPKLKNEGLPAEVLLSILTVLLSKDTPMVNLKHNQDSSIQVSLPKMKGSIPNKIGDTTLLPIDESKAGLRLAVSPISMDSNKVQIRADVTFWDPKRGFAAAGAEWQELVFHQRDGKWLFYKSLGGAIK
ncbi:MAG: hypothetical protein ACYSYL_09485 [Planctomycetota bacterium]